jgi:hypothetical protein
MRTTASLLIAFAVWLACSLNAAAGTPWQKMAIFRQVEADADKNYELADSHGPWLITAATFSGDEAAEQAHELVLELRSRYKLKAYTYDMELDLSKRTTGRRMDRYNQPVRMRYQKERVYEIAVLVGNYPSADSPEAQRVLRKIRELRPDCLDTQKRAKQGKKEYRTLAHLRAMQDEVNRTILKNNRPQGPMRHAMLVTNPLRPDEEKGGVDALVEKMNAPVKYSLLKCPAPYTCKIATFGGSVLIDQKLIDEVQNHGKKLESRLEEAAAKAHELTVALRAKGYEAYEYHDRYASIVTVGSFVSVGTPRPDGKIEIEPSLHKIMQTFSAPKDVRPGKATKVGQPYVVQTKLGKIPCDINAMPVKVPRRSISRDYDRPTF